MNTIVLRCAHVVTVITREVFGVSLAISGMVALGILVPTVALIGYVGFYKLFPYYSAETAIPGSDLKLRLDCSLTADGTSRDRGLNLVATTSRGGAVSTPLWTTDCTHWARTSIYRVDDANIAVLGPIETDYRLSLTPLRFTREFPGLSSANWQYLGAFDFVEIKKGVRRLRFFEAQEQPECIPMAMDQVDWSKLPRAAARHPTCPELRGTG